MKRIILCSDGTWNKPGGGSRNSNVVKITRAILPMAQGGIPQIVFYDEGVGTGNILDRVLGGVTGSGLEKNVRDLYRFLVHNYEDGDEIYLFGFSRGAFTARSTAGLIRSAGVLKKEHLNEFEEGYRIYRSHEIRPQDPAAVKFRVDYAFSPDPRIQFVGAWDTVGSRGIPIRRWRNWLSAIPGLRRWHRRKFEFHDTSLSSCVAHAFHAVAIDERRSAFEPTLWVNQPDDDQTVAQPWFAGVHSNIGGAHADEALSRITLRAMADAAAVAGLEFAPGQIPTIGADDYTGAIPRSPGGVYRVLPKYERPIGATQLESVSDFAIERRENRALNYHPQNLEDYLNR